ncbi:uroporphyrinogen-III synthase [Epibacterium ulvae]|uniref:uroporphyrinogen-III synthase n=1 Tax=Epibacterium ulvae TaxID=1156985 RepID=UPI0024917C0A|nr:uroporphyrinogen-III synthase [Epibacterium ulvae]
MTVLLLTRPKDASARFWSQFTSDEQASWQSIVSPLLEIVAKEVSFDLSGYAGVVFTSTHAVEITSQKTMQRGLAFCVGRHTTDRAVALGWDAYCFGANVDGFVRALDPVQGPLLHLRGQHTRGDLCNRLQNQGQLSEETIVYDQRYCSFSTAAQRALEAEVPVIAPIFSPRTAEQFVKLCSAAQNLYLVAMSEAVAEPLSALDAKDLIVAQDPTAAAMAEGVRLVAMRLARVEGNKTAQ